MRGKPDLTLRLALLACRTLWASPTSTHDPAWRINPTFPTPLLLILVGVGKSLSRGQRHQPCAPDKKRQGTTTKDHTASPSFPVPATQLHPTGSLSCRTRPANASPAWGWRVSSLKARARKSLRSAPYKQKICGEKNICRASHQPRGNPTGSTLQGSAFSMLDYSTFGTRGKTRQS